MHSTVSSDVWQRRTHRIIAMAVIIIALTMMISTIPQCIYIGLVFLMLSLLWLGWMRMKEKKAEPPNPTLHHQHAGVSPVLFLVASQNFVQRPSGPTPVDPTDKPPSYDQILKLDGLPPDYFAILSTLPPRYEDIEGTEKQWSVSIPIDVESPVAGLAAVHSYREVNRRRSSGSGSSSFIAEYSSSQCCGNSSQHFLDIPSMGEVQPCEVPSIGALQPCEVQNIGELQPCEVPKMDQVQLRQMPSIVQLQPCEVPTVGELSVQPREVPTLGDLQPCEVPTISGEQLYEVPTIREEARSLAMERE